MSGFDPEKPYIDAAEKAERLESYIDKATDDLLFRLQDIKEAETFVSEWCDDNAGRHLALLISIICTHGQTVEVTREKLIEALSSIIMPCCESKGQEDMENDTGADDNDEDR
jgi:hypothetical protein